jgi:DNA-directed RNA polymerase specialized sigma24 family protein
MWEQLVPDMGDTPEQEADDGVRRDRLQGCLARLPEVERAVIFGHYFHEITLEVLTNELGLTNRSGARATLIAAQRRLRRCMEEAEQPRRHRRVGGAS